MSSSFSKLDEQVDSSDHCARTAPKGLSENDLLPLINWADVESEESDYDAQNKASNYEVSDAKSCKSHTNTIKSTDTVLTSAPVPADDSHHDPKITNPFAEEEDTHDEKQEREAVVEISSCSEDTQISKTGSHSLKANIQTNPFAEDYDETAVCAGSVEEAMHRESVPTGKGTTNPFAEDYNPYLATRSQSSRTIASSPKAPVVASKSNPAVNASRETKPGYRKSAPLIFPSDQPDLDTRQAKNDRTTKSPKSSSAIFPEESIVFKGTVVMMNLGFTPIASYRAIVSENDYDKALAKLRRNLKTEVNVKVSGCSPLWNPPVVVRIGKILNQALLFD